MPATDPEGVEPSEPQSAPSTSAEPEENLGPAVEEAVSVDGPATTAKAVKPITMIGAAAAARSFTAPPPLTVVPRGRFTLEFVVPWLTWKYVWGVPLHRLREVWETQKVPIAAGTLVGVLKAVGPPLQP